MNLEAISIVLVSTTHSGNIGAVARAMANMGLSRLALVTPRASIDEEARARASGADHVLDGATVHASLADAVADAVFVVGTSARQRMSRWREFDPPQAADAIAGATMPGHSAAVVFGRESSGLSNAELDRCDALVSIPVDPAFPSLNLAAAVTVLGYELRKRHLVDAPAPTDAHEDHARPATAAERERFFEHLVEVLGDAGFLRDHGQEKLMRKIRYLYTRAEPDSEEVAILRGILTMVQRKIRK